MRFMGFIVGILWIILIVFIILVFLKLPVRLRNLTWAGVLRASALYLANITIRGRAIVAGR